MTNLLDKLVTYLALHAELEPGVSAFYNEMPDEPNKCLVVQEEQNGYAVPAQIDAEVHRIRVVARDEGNESACVLAQLCWRWLLTDNAQYDTDKRVDTTGFINLAGDTVQVRLFGNPVWDKADQQSRKYYCFYALITTPR
jgi:hypothetical protein